MLIRLAMWPFVFSTSIYPYHFMYRYGKDRSVFSLWYNKSFKLFKNLQINGRAIVEGCFTDIRYDSPYIWFAWKIVEQTTIHYYASFLNGFMNSKVQLIKYNLDLKVKSCRWRGSSTSYKASYSFFAIKKPLPQPG